MTGILTIVDQRRGKRRPRAGWCFQKIKNATRALVWESQKWKKIKRLLSKTNFELGYSGRFYTANVFQLFWFLHLLFFSLIKALSLSVLFHSDSLIYLTNYFIRLSCNCLWYCIIYSCHCLRLHIFILSLCILPFHSWRFPSSRYIHNAVHDHTNFYAELTHHLYTLSIIIDDTSLCNSNCQ